tara:strand:- start:462 stop:791 length:330 start_codon:yes stop_codon:yes gene_type:complete
MNIIGIVLSIIGCITIIGFAWLTVKAYIDFTKALNIRKEIKEYKESLEEIKIDLNRHKELVKLFKKELGEANTVWTNNLEIRINNELAKQLPEAIRKTIAHIEFAKPQP